MRKLTDMNRVKRNSINLALENEQKHKRMINMKSAIMVQISLVVQRHQGGEGENPWKLLLEMLSDDRQGLVSSRRTEQKFRDTQRRS